MADNMADTATDTAAADTATLVAILGNEGIAITTPDNSSPVLANAAAIAPSADGTVTIESAAVTAARVYVASIETALNMLDATSPAYAALTDSLATANGALALALADAQLDAAKLAEIDAARAAAANLPADLLAVMLDAIERKYAPAPIVPDAAPAPDVADNTRRGPSDRTLALNAAASVDTEMAARASASTAAFNSDAAKLACTVNRRPNTRFSGMVALSPSSGGVANYADYDRLTRAIRHHLINVERWSASAADGQSVPEAKWLAARGRYVVGGGVKSALDCFHSGAEIAQYPDGRFRFAYRGTANVRFLRTDNAAWQAFVGGAQTTPAVQAPVTTVATPDAASTARTAPTPPQTIALPNGGLASTARCQHCTARNIVGAAECSACGAAEWLTA